MGNTTTRLENSGNSEYDNDRVEEKYVKCIECVRLIPVLSLNDLKPGDHIVFRNVHYDHHGIVYSVDDVKKNYCNYRSFKYTCRGISWYSKFGDSVKCQE